MIHHGDCLEVMATLPEASVDAICTDPPAGIAFMAKEWDDFRRRRNPNDAGRDDVFGRTSRSGPEYGRALDHFAEWMTGVALAMKRVLKPGGYMLVWALPKTSFATGWALYRAGLEPRDGIAHIFASGFPKSRASLKPAWEHWLLFRKPGPLRELAIDACRIGVGEEVPGGGNGKANNGGRYGGGANYSGERPRVEPHQAGRWPANIVLTDPIFDGDVEGVVGGGETSGAHGGKGDFRQHSWIGPAGFTDRITPQDIERDGGGTYSRFFIIPKSARAEREPNEYGRLVGGLEERDEDAGSPVRNARCQVCGKVKFAASDARCRCDVPVWAGSSRRTNGHPTVKPLDLMRHLVRLVTPVGGTVLDPFLGSGTTGIACEMEGFPWVGVERELEYVQIAEARLQGVQRGLGLSA